ncbi:hypothetical protein QYF36_022681 [Acer negundo]|nr:hypothetical protein QYF36_022681 [Acer negundo]
MVLKGPCKGPINFHLQGDLVAHIDEASNQVDHWIAFRYIDQLTINGGGHLMAKAPQLGPTTHALKIKRAQDFPLVMQELRLMM